DESNESTKVFDDEEPEEATRIGGDLTGAPQAAASFTLPSAQPNKGKATLLGLTPPPASISTVPPPNRAVGTRPPPPPPSSAMGGFPIPAASSFPPPPAINQFPPALATTPGLGSTPGGRTMPPMAPPRMPTPIPRPAAVPEFGQDPPPRRPMEATALLRPPQNRTALFAA